MNPPIKRFKSMGAALQYLAPFIREPYAKLLRTGRPLADFGGMLPRELLGNWLVCVTANKDQPDRPLYFTTDPTGGDGVVIDEKNEIAYHFEHVFAPQPATGEILSGDELVKAAVAQKQRKGGRAYAAGKNLVVLLDKADSLCPTETARTLPQHDFAGVWVIAQVDLVLDEYAFAVTRLFPMEGHEQAPTFWVRINQKFDTWGVARAQ